MRLDELRLFDFRNYAALELHSRADINLFVGQNAQGKSNLLEAIYLLATGRSFRTSAERELIGWGSKAARVMGRLSRSTSVAQISVQLRHEGPKRVEVNGDSLRRLSDLYGVFNAVLFTPDDLQLVKGGPDQRRRYLDTLLFQVSAAYRQESLKYHRVLKQRNSMLKELAEGQGDPALLDAFTEQLCDAGGRLIARRALALKELAVSAADAYAQISGARERLHVWYMPSFVKSPQPPDPAWEDAQAMRARLAAEAARLHRGEMARAQTLFGPQRDDLGLYLDGHEARPFASQGQQRSITLALKQAEVVHLQAQSGEWPVLLLDDVLSELDHERRAHLLGGIGEHVQTFVTTTHVEPFAAWADRPLGAYRIEAGALTPL